MVEVDSGKCTGCGICIDACPQGAISIRDNVAVVDHRLCISCGNCAEACVADAIRITEPVYVRLEKGGDEMRGRGWFGWGYRGRGRGNPYPFCRVYPRLPRGWWVYGAREYRQTLRQLLSMEGESKELRERVDLLRAFLATADFKKLRRESEKYLAEKRRVTFVLYCGEETPQYEIRVT